MSTIDDIRYKVNGAVYFSKIDLNKGYHQLGLQPNSRNITTFSTHLGLARYKRLNFGCKSATEIFHETIRKKLISVKGALNIHDDILIYYFDPQLETQIICDASPFGLGTTVVQIKDGEQQIVAYASRALTKTKQNYGHIEREALAILFGCLKFQTYVLGYKFVVITNHVPLVPCLNNPKSQMPYRIERIRIKLQEFDLSVKYCSGENNISDFISRQLSEEDNKISKEEKEIIEHVHTLLDNTFDRVSMQELREAVTADSFLVE